jgi:hypothetical protein
MEKAEQHIQSESIRNADMNELVAMWNILRPTIRCIMNKNFNIFTI